MREEFNPVTKKIYDAVKAGKVTWEELCVKLELKYPTIMNMVLRNRVSYGTMLSLRKGGLVSDEEYKAYQAWLGVHGAFQKHGGTRKRKFRTKKEFVRAKNGRTAKPSE